jgi:non-ribosomal peptide synthetase component F
MNVRHSGTSPFADRLREQLSAWRRQLACEIPAVGIRRTYGELLEATEYWRALLPGTETVVLYVEKSIEFYEIVLTCFLHGIDFCPVDRVNPLSRLVAVMRHFHSLRLVTDDAQAAGIGRAPAIYIDREAGRVHVSSPAANVENGRATRREAFYFIPTSGTTRAPRIVVGRHRATEPFTDWAVNFYGVRPGVRWSQFSSVGFDLTLADLLTVTRGGGALIAPTTYSERLKPGTFIRDHALTHWHSVPSVIPYLLREGDRISGVECFSFCGETLLRRRVAALQELAPHARIINTYGTTESTLFSSAYEITADDLDDSSLTSIPVGAPLPGWKHFYVDDSEALAMRLFIAGDHLSEGYLGADSSGFGELTLRGRRTPIFDTGDFFTARARGMCFSHREDGQVKVAGNRVDVNEVADACSSLGFHDVCVELVDGTLAAFIASTDGPEAVRGLTLRLRELLPSYAVPTRVRVLPELPRGASGKIDRRALVDGIRRG